METEYRNIVLHIAIGLIPIALHTIMIILERWGTQIHLNFP